MTIPSPPADTSGGYLICTYANATDSHKMRLHVRAFAADGTYTTPATGTPTTVQADFTQLMGKVAPFYDPSWRFNMTALFLNNNDGTFTEIFGWTPPAPVIGTSGTVTPADQTRATETIFNFRDGHGGRGRLTLIGTPLNPAVSVPTVQGGAAGGNASQQLIDAITNPAKTNVVSHGGHQFQSPARLTFSVNRRLRRHYGFA